jgi:glycosyltransferase involved in cell wall biosynthesis
MGLKKDNKRILLILPYGSVGGMERLALTFYEYYLSLGYFIKAIKFIKLESDIIDFGENELFLSLKDFNNMSAQGRYGFYLKAPLALRKLIKKYKITHSIAFGDMANLFSSLTFTNEYKIGSVHALKSVELSSPTFFNKMIRFGLRSSYKNLNKLVCISKSIKEDLIVNCNYGFDNLQVIYNPHSIEKLIAMSLEPIVDPEELELFKGETILFLGRLSVQKSPWHLIHAFNILAVGRRDLKLLFIGDGDQQVMEYIKTLTTHLNLDERVFFLGRRNNPYTYLKKVSCLALTSNYEGTPNVIVEAIALNTPVVTSFCTSGILELMSIDEKLTYDNKGILETEAGIITPNFYEGTLGIPNSFEVRSTDKIHLFAKGLEKVLDATANGMGTASKKELLLRKFDLSTIAKEYLTEKN